MFIITKAKLFQKILENACGLTVLAKNTISIIVKNQKGDKLHGINSHDSTIPIGDIN